MKTLAVATLMLFLPLALTAQVQHLKFTQDGAFANLTLTPGPLSVISVQVSENSSTSGGTSASLSYSEVDEASDFSSLTFVQIFGAIPASSFTANTTQHMVLSFDTSQLDPTTSLSQSCTVDLNTFTVVCGPGPTGQIQLDFQENGAQRTQILALQQVSTVGPLTVRTHQSADTSSADVQGTIFGTAVSSSAGQIGINHNSTLEMTVNQ